MAETHHHEPAPSPESAPEAIDFAAELSMLSIESMDEQRQAVHDVVNEIRDEVFENLEAGLSRAEVQERLDAATEEYYEQVRAEDDELFAKLAESDAFDTENPLVERALSAARELYHAYSYEKMGTMEWEHGKHNSEGEIISGTRGKSAFAKYRQNILNALNSTVEHEHEHEHGPDCGDSCGHDHGHEHEHDDHEHEDEVEELDLSGYEMISMDEWNNAEAELNEARNELARILSRDGIVFDNNEDYEAALNNFADKIATLEDMYVKMALGSGMDKEAIEKVLNSEGGMNERKGFAGEFKKLRELLPTIDTHPEQAEQGNWFTKKAKSIGRTALKGAKLLGRHKIMTATAIGVGSVLTGGTVGAAVAAGSLWAARRGGGALTMKGYNAAGRKLMNRFFARRSKLTTDVLDRLKNNDIDDRGRGSEHVREAVNALRKDAKFEQYTTVALNAGAIATALVAGGSIARIFEDIFDSPEKVIGDVSDGKGEAEAEEYNPFDPSRVEDGPDSEGQTGRSTEDTGEQTEGAEATGENSRETESTPELPAAYVYDVQPGDGITHALSGLAQEIDVCDNLNGADYYAVYQMYEDQLGALDNTYRMANGDFGIADPNKDFIIGSELRDQIEDSLRERAGVTEQAVETEAPVAETQEAPAETPETEEQEPEVTEVAETEESEETVAPDDTEDTQPVADVQTSTDTDVEADTSSSINIDIRNVETDEVREYLEDGLFDYISDVYTGANNINISDLEITDEQLTDQVFDALKTDIANSDIVVDTTKSLAEQIADVENAAIKDIIDRQLEEILDTDIGAFETV